MIERKILNRDFVKKRMAILSILCLLSTTVLAQNVLSVHSKTGAVVCYAFSEKPVITYENDVLVLRTEKTCVEYPLSDLAKLTFCEEKTAVESITASGIKGNSTIRIFDTDGRSVKTIEADGNTDSSPELLLKDLERGVYIVRQGEISYKIYRE